MAYSILAENKTNICDNKGIYIEKRAHWPHRSPDKTLKIVNVFSLFRNYLPLAKDLIPFTQGCFVQVWLKLAARFWEKIVNVILLFRNYLPLEKGETLHLNKLESTSFKDALCQVWLKLTLWLWKRRF